MSLRVWKIFRDELFYKVISFLGPICCFQVTVTMTVTYTVVGRDVLDVSVTIKISKRM